MGNQGKNNGQIAIIGMGCLLPGGNTPEAFYESLLNHGEYLDQDIIYDVNVKALQADVDEKLLERLDENFKYTLYVVHEALKDSGYLGNAAVLAKTGLIMGNREPVNQKAFDLFKPIYLRELERHLRVLLHRPDFRFVEPDDSGNTSPLNMFHFSYPALFTAQALSMKGPVYAIDAACAASLYTTKMATYYLLSGQMDLMLSGGVFTGKYNKGFPYYMKKLGVTPKQAKSRPLDKNSGGMVVNEGGGILVLKRLADAVRDGDNIHAVIESCGWSNDGTGKFFLAPSKDGQVIAYQNAFGDEDPDGIDYIECHATGTQIGDGVELASLDEFYGTRPHVPMIGAVKGNIGHLLTGAGAASIIKVIMAIKKGIIPATINVTDPQTSPNGVFSGKNMILANTPWPQQSAVKRAAISAMGFGGINSHLILREYLPGEMPAAADEKPLKREEIAITGIGLHFGNLENIKQFNNALFYGKQPQIQRDPPRLRGMGQNKEALAPYHLAEGFPRGFYHSPFTFDYLNNKVNPKDDHEIIDKEMLLMKVAGEALIDAGIEAGAPQNIATVICAKQNLCQLLFYMSSYIPDFLTRAIEAAGISLDAAQVKDLIKICRRASDPKENDFDRIATGIGPIIATRIAALWNFTGPTFKMSCMDNSFLRGIEYGKFLLENGDVDAVLVGAVDNDPLLENIAWHYRFGKACGIDPSGMTFGEGAAACVLRKVDSVGKGKVYARINDIAIHRADAPLSSCPSFPDMVARIHRDVSGNHDMPGYVEFYGHMARTPLLTEALQKMEGVITKEEEQGTTFGFAADHFGDNNMTSQAASVIKAALMLYYSFKPPTPKAVSKERAVLGTPLVKPADLPWYWQHVGQTRKVAVMGATQDGSTGCILLTEPGSPMPGLGNETAALNPPLILIAHRDEAGFREELTALKETLKKEPSLTHLCLEYSRRFNAEKGPEKSYTLALMAETMEKLAEDIENVSQSLGAAFQAGKEWQGPNGSAFTAAPLGKQAKLAIIYPPSGLNSDNALYELTTTFPQLVVAYDAFIRSNAHRKHEHITRFNEYLKNKEQLPLYMDAILAHLTTRLVMDVLHISPDMIMGCSFGELVMCTATGMVKEEGDADMINDIVAPLVAKLSDHDYLCRYFGDENAEWVTYYCKGSRKVMATLVKELEKTDKAFPTIRGSAENIIISGLRTECERILKKTKCFSYQISRNIFVHTPPAMAFYDEIVTKTIDHPFTFCGKPAATYYSTRGGLTFDFDKKQFANNMAHCICKSVDFEAVINRAYADGARIFIGMDSSDLCTEWISNTLKDRDALILPLKQSSLSLGHSVHRLVARLFAHGFALNAEQLIHYPHPHQSSKGLVRTINQRPSSVGDLILTAENREKFRHLAPEDIKPLEKVALIPEKKVDIRLAKIPAQVTKVAPIPKKKVDIRPTQIPVKVIPESSPQPITMIPIPATPPAMFNRELQQRFDENVKVHRTFLDVQNILNSLLHEGILAQYGNIPKIADMPEAEASTGLSKIHPQRKVVWNEKQIFEMTAGKMSNILGSRYSGIDTYPIRARLPLPPFMFVSRVTDIQGEFGQLKPSQMEMEYDVPVDAWYLNEGRVPFPIMTESSHCGILLLSYIGVDEIFKGQLRFRALNSTTKILSEKMLRAGETCRGIFRITSFATVKDITLAFYTYDLFDSEDVQFFTMKGVGGFFREKDLQSAKGYPDTAVAKDIMATKADFKPFLTCEKHAFTAAEIANLQQGRNDLCFGRGYVAHNEREQIYSDNFRILHRVSHVDAHGGPYGLGLIKGEADIDPAHWIFGAHFKNDPVLPGIFTIEGGIQLLSFYIHYIGLKDIAGPGSYRNTLLGTESKALFRGEVRREATTLTYECVIKKITSTPEITIASDIKVFNGDRIIAVITDMGMKLIRKERCDEASLVA